MRSEAIEADKQRWAEIENPLTVPQFRFLYVKRKCEQWKGKAYPIYLVYRLIYQRYKVKYMMDIPARVNIGRGFRIEHTGGIVINPKASIGSNVTMLNGVLVGAQNRGKHKGYPVIGDKVWIGTNAIIVGGISIGSNVLIAPGAYVNFDVPGDSIVLGNPGRVIPCATATNHYLMNIVE